MKWRLAPALATLRTQVDAKWPSRSRAADGTIGDPAHAARTSDHNPNAAGIVTGMDLTHDPAHGLDSEELAQALIRVRDPRLKYVISNRKIAAGNVGPSPWKWRVYTGQNAHNHHCHISVNAERSAYDSTAPWNLDGVEAPPPHRPHLITRPTLQRGDTGVGVKALQSALGIKADGEFGAETEKAVRARQALAKLVPDGVVGPYTWDLLT